MNTHLPIKVIERTCVHGVQITCPKLTGIMDGTEVVSWVQAGTVRDVFKN